MFTSRSNFIFVKLWTEQMEVSQLWNNQYQQWNRSDMDVFHLGSFYKVYTLFLKSIREGGQLK